MVHTFSLLGQHIAVDVNSGAVHILDEITYHVLRQMEEAATPLDKIIAALGQYSPESISESYGELQELVAKGELFAPADYVDPAMAMIKNAPVKINQWIFLIFFLQIIRQFFFIKF